MASRFPEANASPVASPDAVEALPPANAQVYLDNIAVMHRLPTTSTWTEVEDAFNAEFDRSFYIENFDVAAAAAAAIENSQDAFDRASTCDSPNNGHWFRNCETSSGFLRAIPVVRRHENHAETPAAPARRRAEQG